MAIALHAVSARSLHRALLVSAAAGIASALVGRYLLAPDVLVAVAWDAWVLTFLAMVLAATTGFDERKMAKKVVHRSPSSALVAVVAAGSAGFGIYAIALLLGADDQPWPGRELRLAIGAATTALSWTLVHLLFALQYARIYYAAGPGGPPAGGLDFPGGQPPDYADFLHFSFTVGVACQTADISITTRQLRVVVLAQSLIAFVFNTVILAATVNVAAGLA